MHSDEPHNWEEADRIVITPKDVAEVKAQQELRRGRRSLIPLWWRIVSFVLVLCPPALFVGTIAGMVAVRHRSLAQRYAHAFHYCCLLLLSGLLLSFVAAGLAMLPADRVGKLSVEATEISLNAFPQLPSSQTLTGREVASELSPLVVVIQPGNDSLFSGLVNGCGAGVIVRTTAEGALVLTSRHVLDSFGGKAQLGGFATITLQDGQRARAAVSGFHNALDLALLWVLLEGAPSEYVQPLRRFESVEVGEEIYVIGHPQGLEWSLSNGLVAQVRAPDTIQVTAPVSPGNSGGPVFDSNGRLMAVIQGVVDKSRSPNAENLNFAVRVDDLLNSNAWTIAEGVDDGGAALAAFSEGERGAPTGNMTSTEEASIDY